MKNISHRRFSSGAIAGALAVFAAAVVPGARGQRASFAEPVYLTTGVLPWQVAVADLNRDGHLDIVHPNRSDSDISVHLGNGNGTFQTQMRFPVSGSHPRAMVVADLDGDGDLDVVTANRYSVNLSVLLGNGNGTFSAPSLVPVGGGIIELAVADLNRDAMPDLVTAYYEAGALNGTVVLLGSGNGTFQSGLFYPAPSDDAEGIAVADLTRLAAPER